MSGVVSGQTQSQHKFRNLPAKIPRKAPEHLVSGQKLGAGEDKKTSFLPSDPGVEEDLTLLA